MLNKIAFATSLAILSGGCYMVLYVLALVWRDAFRLLFNAQFFGADVASLLPGELTYGGFLGTFLVLLVSAWLLGFVWAWLYNWLAG